MALSFFLLLPGTIVYSYFLNFCYMTDHLWSFVNNCNISSRPVNVVAFIACTDYCVMFTSAYLLPTRNMTHCVQFCWLLPGLPLLLLLLLLIILLSLCWNVIIGASSCGFWKLGCLCWCIQEFWRRLLLPWNDASTIRSCKLAEICLFILVLASKFLLS